MANHLELEKLRQKIGLTQAGMAEIMGISVPGYEELEAGRMRVKDLHLFAARHAAIKRAINLNKTHELPQDLRDMLELGALQLKHRKAAGLFQPA
jgi:transcriptional regulator with XRE-family HTH domain